MLILNAGKSHNSNDWFMWLTIENKRTKEGLRLEKRCWIKLAHHSVIWSYMELWTLDWCLVYCSGTLRYRPTTFMKSGRPKSFVFKFKAWPQKKNQNLSCNPAQTLLRSLPIYGVLKSQIMSYLVGETIRQFTTTFMNTTCSNSDVSNDISSRQELEGYPPRPPEVLLSILAISRVVVIPMLWNVVGGKRRWFPTTIMQNTLSNSDCINVISSSQNAWVLLSTKSIKLIVDHYINNQLPNE